jgi:hypothetical protein
MCVTTYTIHLADNESLQGWTSALTRNLSLPAERFVAGGFAIDPTPAAPMTIASIVGEGIEMTDAIKVFSQHTYQYSTCDPRRNAIATLPHLVDHQNITVIIYAISRE